MLTAEFHAVWDSPTGDLIDIAPKPHGEDRIVFVPDPSYLADFDFDRRPLNKRQRRYEPVDPSAAVAVQIARMRSAQRAYEAKRAARTGATLEQSLRSKRPSDPWAQIIDDLIRVRDEYDEELDAAPGTGYIRAMPNLQLLLERKLRLQEQLKRVR